MIQEIQNNIDKINTGKNFRAVWNSKLQCIEVLLNNIKLFPMIEGLPDILSRQQGYDLEISEMYKTELNFQSAEEKYSIEGEPDLYHKHYYFFTEAIDKNKVEVLVKYYDVPDSKNMIDIDQYLLGIKNKVASNPNYQIEYVPFGKEEAEMKFGIGGFCVRPKTNGSFYFSTEIEADTYGDVMLKVDQIIHSLEN